VKAIVQLAGALVGSVWLQTAGSKVRSFGQCAGCYLRCATCVIAGQFATSHCKPLLNRVSLVSGGI